MVEDSQRAKVDELVSALYVHFNMNIKISYIHRQFLRLMVVLVNVLTVTYNNTFLAVCPFINKNNYPETGILLSLWKRLYSVD